MSKFKINILFLTFVFYLISGFSLQASAQNQNDWGNDEDWGSKKKKGLFKRKSKTNESGEVEAFKAKEPFFKRIFKGKKGIEDPVADAKKEKNTNFQVIESEYFDGKKLNDKEQKKIAKQVRKYNKQKPSKWEQNYLEMRKRGYPVHPDTVRKYRNLAAKVQRQKDARTRKMKKIYRKSLYDVQGKEFFTKADVGKKMEAKHKETTKKQKQKARRLKRRQRTGYYLPFYQRWYESFSKKQQKKRNKKNRQKKNK